MMALAQGATGSNGDPVVNVGVFGAFVVITLFVVYRVGARGSTASDYYTAGRGFTGAQNGIALTGDFLSAASFLGISGAIAVYGYDGFLYSIGWLVCWLVTLLLIAEPVRNTGRFTMGDVLSYRMRQRQVRAASATSTLVISLFYLLAQMAGAGGLIALLLDIHEPGSQAIAIAVVGVVMLIYVLLGGMKGTTWVQIMKSTGLVICLVMLAVFLLGKFGFSISALLDEAVNNNSKGTAILEPGTLYGASEISKIDLVSLSIALIMGAAGLPHILMRFYTVPNAKQARRSVVWTIGTVALFYFCTLIVGYGASALVGSNKILNSSGGENSATPLLAFEVGGTVLLGIISAIAFATILGVVSGLTLTASASFAHDVYANIFKRGKVAPDAEVRVARLAAVAIGMLGIGGGVLFNGQNVAFLVGIAFAFSASANVPTMLYSLFWKRFNTSGTLWSMYGGLISCLLLVVFSPVVSGKKTSILPEVDFALFPLSNPGIVSIPLSFVLGFLGTVFGKEETNKRLRSEMTVKAVTGIGVAR